MKGLDVIIVIINSIHSIIDSYLAPADEVALPPHVAASMLPPHLTVACHINLQTKAGSLQLLVSSDPLCMMTSCAAAGRV